MKKYIVFGYDYYYPSGGLQDIIGQANSLEEAKSICKKRRRDIFEIVDRDTWKIVWEN